MPNLFLLLKLFCSIVKVGFQRLAAFAGIARTGSSPVALDPAAIDAAGSALSAGGFGSRQLKMLFNGLLGLTK